MKPILTVEGKEFEVYAVYYRDSKVHSVTIMDENNVARQYHDINENTQYYIERPLQLDFSKALKWKGRYDEVYETLDKLIEDNQKEIQDLATEIADSYLPFVTPEKYSTREKLKIRTFGLMDAQDIIHGFMEDDVDLSGGED